MLNDPRIAPHDADRSVLVLDKYDPALAVQQGFRPIEPAPRRFIFWCLVVSLSICVVMLTIDLV